MTKEEIKKQALKTYTLKSLDVAETITRHISVQGFVDGAEWMQNEMQAKYALDLAVELEQQRYELIEKMQQWAEDWFCNGEEWMRRTEFIEGIQEEIRQVMKGEKS